MTGGGRGDRKAPQAEGENGVHAEGEDYFSCPSVPVQDPEDENPNSIPGDEGSPWGSLSSTGRSWRQRRLAKKRLSVTGRGSWGRKRTDHPTLT